MLARRRGRERVMRERGGIVAEELKGMEDGRWYVS